MIRQPVTISVETYTTILDKEGLGEPHPTLVGGSRWYSPDEARLRDVRVLDELREQGLASGTGLSEDFHEALITMQRATVEYYTIASIDGGARTIRTARHGRDAVLVSSRDQSIEISPIPVEQMGVRVAATLPETPAARVHSMSCDPADLDAAAGDKALGSDPSSRDAKRMKRFLDQERTSAGQFYAAIRGGDARRRSTRSPVPFWFDTETGRALLSPGTNGWLTLIGADLMTIAGKLTELENALRG